jgi:hypothetical protein
LEAIDRKNGVIMSVCKPILFNGFTLMVVAAESTLRFRRDGTLISKQQ